MSNSLFGKGYSPRESGGSSKKLPAGGYICRIMNAKIENAKTELSLFKYSELNRIFPQDHIPFYQIEEYVKKLKENEQK